MGPIGKFRGDAVEITYNEARDILVSGSFPHEAQ
jgi:hypothetical protein